MRTIDHHYLPLPLLPQRIPRLLHALLIEICSRRPTPHDNKTIRIPASLSNRRQALLRHTHEMVSRCCCTNGVYRDS